MAVEVLVIEGNASSVKDELDRLALQPGIDLGKNAEGHVHLAYGAVRGKPSAFAGAAGKMAGVVSATTK